MTLLEPTIVNSLPMLGDRLCYHFWSHPIYRISLSAMFTPMYKKVYIISTITHCTKYSSLSEHEWLVLLSQLQKFFPFLYKIYMIPNQRIILPNNTQSRTVFFLLSLSPNYLTHKAKSLDKPFLILSKRSHWQVSESKNYSKRLRET